MTSRPTRQTFLRALAGSRFPHALAAGLLLFGSSCSSSRDMAHRGQRPASKADPFVSTGGGSEVTHAHTAVPSGQENNVTQLSADATPKTEPAPAREAIPQAETVQVAEARPAAGPRSFPVEAAVVTAASAGSSVPSISQVSYGDLAEAAVKDSSSAAEQNSSSSTSDPFLGEEARFPQEVVTDTPATVPVRPFPAPEPGPASESITDAETDSPSPFVSKVDPPAGPALAGGLHAPEACPPIGVPGFNCPPLDCPTANCPPASPAPFLTIPGLYQIPAIVADEYLCDGGDKRLPVHYTGPARMGLDTEDTVVEYRDHEGRAHVKPSTRACVYAPRFASVLSVSEPLTGLAINRASGTHDGQPLAALHGRTVLDEQVQRDSLYAMHMRARASSVLVQESDSSLVKNDRPNIHAKLVNAFEDYGFIREGLYGKVDIAILEAAIEAAFAWDGDQSLAIYAVDQAGQAVVGKRFAEDMTGIEDRRKPGDLQIVKVADKASAHAGDVVTFTIRFDNVGDRELLNVRVVDNLTPRLQFIEGSIQSSAHGSMHLEDNQAGGKVLTFEFTEPLKGKTGAFITFQCKVL